MSVTLVRTKLHADNAAKYGIPGVRGSISVSKSLFPAGVVAPESLEIVFDGFTTPDASAIAKAEKRETRKAEIAAKIAERVTKAKERAEKAMQRAAKLEAQAQKLNAKANAGKTDAEA